MQNLGDKNMKELLKMAKELNIIGRHDMRKQQLVEAIVDAMDELLEKDEVVNVKPKQNYIETAKIGTLIAFKVNETKVISGMIEEIHKAEFVVRTKTGIRFNVRWKNVVWVKTGPRWPSGVYRALKGVTDENKTAN